MVMEATKVKPNRGAIERALACAILAERALGLSVHTHAALRSISERLLEGQAVSWEEYRAAAYAYFASTLD